MNWVTLLTQTRASKASRVAHFPIVSIWKDGDHQIEIVNASTSHHTGGDMAKPTSG